MSHKQEEPKREFLRAFGSIERYTRKGKKLKERIAHYLSIRLIKKLK